MLPLRAGGEATAASRCDKSLVNNISADFGSPLPRDIRVPLALTILTASSQLPSRHYRQDVVA